MVDNNYLRGRLIEATTGRFGELNRNPVNLENVFGKLRLPSAGSNWYDMEAFIAQVYVNVSDKLKYVFGQSISKVKPRKWQWITTGVSVPEDAVVTNFSPESIQARIDTELEAADRAVMAKQHEYFIGYSNGAIDDVSALHAQAADATSTLANPADCNSTPGTAAALGGINFTGAGLTERNLESTLGEAQIGINSKCLNATTGESILHNDGTDTYDAWVHPNFYKILDTSHDLLDSGEHDPLTYIERAKQTWKTTFRPSMHIAACTGASDATTIMLVTANTAENFKIVNVIGGEAKWLSWADIDDGNVIQYVKRYRAAQGAVAKPYKNPTTAYFYKAMYAMTVTPNGA